MGVGRSTGSIANFGPGGAEVCTLYFLPLLQLCTAVLQGANEGVDLAVCYQPASADLDTAELPRTDEVVDECPADTQSLSGFVNAVDHPVCLGSHDPPPSAERYGICVLLWSSLIAVSLIGDGEVLLLGWRRVG